MYGNASYGSHTITFTAKTGYAFKNGTTSGKSSVTLTMYLNPLVVTAPTLKSSTDYTLSNSNRTATMTYNGSSHTAYLNASTWSSNPNKDYVTATPSGETATSNSWNYSSNTCFARSGAGTSTVTFHLDDPKCRWNTGNADDITLTLVVNQRKISNATIANINDDNAVNYTGSAQTPRPTVTDSIPKAGTALVENTDFTYGWSSNTNAGTATITITGKGNYTGTKTKTFTINKLDITPTLSYGTVT